MPLRGKTVLITGASSGIGAATAARLQKAGWNVYATARRPEHLSALRDHGCKTMALDVTNDASMRATVADIETREGAIDVLINNAGYSQSGALETVDVAAVRRQFETNVFGLLRLTQMVLPGMRRKGGGRIVNISSMGGKLTFPGGGAYHASKYAVESLSDALRYELAGFGIDVVIIEPGLIKSGFADVAAEGIGAAVASDPYADFNRSVAQSTRSAYEKGPLAAMSGTPDGVAAAIETALTTAHPKARYKVTASAHVMMALRRLMTDRMWDKFLSRSFRRPGVQN